MMARGFDVSAPAIGVVRLSPLPTVVALLVKRRLPGSVLLRRGRMKWGSPPIVVGNPTHQPLEFLNGKQ
jgi:lipopolysaccharide/colanic/teichoic acid biosynthesis glycosyltransferase